MVNGLRGLKVVLGRIVQPNFGSTRARVWSEHGNVSMKRRLCGQRWNTTARLRQWRQVRGTAFGRRRVRSRPRVLGFGRGRGAEYCSGRLCAGWWRALHTLERHGGVAVWLRQGQRLGHGSRATARPGVHAVRTRRRHGRQHSRMHGGSSLTTIRWQARSPCRGKVVARRWHRTWAKDLTRHQGLVNTGERRARVHRVLGERNKGPGTS